MEDLPHLHHQIPDDCGQGVMGGVRQTQGKDLDSSKQLNILYTNADSLKNKLGQLELLAVEYKPEIIVITEILPKRSWSQMIELEFKITNYEIFTNLELCNNVRGIAIYVKIGLQIIDIKFDNSFKEFIHCRIRQENGESINLVAIYRSPNSIENNNIALTNLITTLVTNYDENLILLGDFNLKNINWLALSCPGSIKSKSFEQQFIDCILNNFLIQHVLEETRLRQGQTSSLLDLVFTIDENLISSIEVCPPLGKSDHAILIIEVNLRSANEFQIDQHNFRLNAGNYEQMRDTLSTVDWDKALYNDNIEQMWQSFKKIVLDLCENLIPRAKRKIVKTPIWMTKDVQDSMDKRKKAWARYIHCRTDQRLRDFQIIRNLTNRKIQEAQSTME